MRAKTDDPRLDGVLEELRATGLLEVLEDDETTDLLINPNGRCYAAAPGRGVFPIAAELDELQAESIIASIAGLEGLTVTPEAPILEATFAGVRVEAVLPPVTTSPALALRKPPRTFYSLGDLEELGAFGGAPAAAAAGAGNGAGDTPLPQAARALLEHLVRERWTVLVAGGVGSGKTTVLSAMVGVILEDRPDERLLICEEGAREVRADGPNTVSLLTSEEAGVDMTRLLRTALRLNPDRLIVGEARGPEAFVFLKATNTGHPGGLLTVHANSATEAVERLDDLAQEAGVPSQRARIAEALDAVVFCRRFPGEERRITEILALDGLAADGSLRTRPLYTIT